MPDVRLLAAAAPALHCCAPAAYWLAAPIAFMLCAVAVAAGVGGGALYMPLYYLATKDAHVAVPLAKVTTNGVGWSGFIFTVLQAHPEKGGPLIDYDVAFLLEPLTLVGTVAGVILHVFLTSTEVLVILVVLLSYVAVRTICKGLSQKAAEDAKLSSQGSRTSSCSKAELELAGRSECGRPHGSAATGPERGIEQSGTAAVCAAVPWWKIGTLTALWLFHAAILVKSGGPMRVACGGFYEWSLISLDASVLGVFTTAWAVRMWRQEKLGREAAAVEGPSGHHFDARSLVLYPLLSGLAGVAAGALGIAGGLLQGPLMIAWGVLPQAATATAIFMTVFTSGSTILQFVILGRLQWVPSIVFWFTGFGGGLLGSKVVLGLLRRQGRQSYVSIFLGVLVLLSMLSMAALDLLQLLGWIAEEPARNLRGVCGAAA